MDRLAAERASRARLKESMSKKTQLIILTLLVVILGGLAFWMNHALDWVASHKKAKKEALTR